MLGGLSGRRDDCSMYRRNSLSIANGLSYKQRTRKVTNAIAMTANWKKDVEWEDDEIRHGIRRKPYGCRDAKKLEGRKIRRYTVGTTWDIYSCKRAYLYTYARVQWHTPTHFTEDWLTLLWVQCMQPFPCLCARDGCVVMFASGCFPLLFT